MRSPNRSRRNFINLAGAGVGGLLAAPLIGSSAAAQSLGLQASNSQYPDQIVINAKVYTVDGALPQAEAIAISADKFSAVGSTAEIRALAGPDTEIVDADGMTILPGFIDCHVHARGETLLYEVLVGNPFEVEFVSIESIIDKLRTKAQALPPGTWVEGYFFDDTKLTDGRELTRRDLDQVSQDHPVLVQHRGGHTSYYNTKAFEMAGVNRGTPNPMGGTFDKDREGQLSGRVTDRARDPMRRIGLRPAFSAEQQAIRSRDGIAYISKQFARYGLTSVHHEGGDLAAIQDVRARGELVHRVSYEATGTVLDAMIDAGIRTGFGDEWIKFGATSEHGVDGSFSERTMAMSVDYPNVSPPYRGNVTESQEVLNAWVERVHRAGIQVNVHANGDVAIDSFLTAIERAQALLPLADARPKITHCTLINDELVRRMKALGCVPAMFTTYAYYNPDKFIYYGEDLMKRSMAYRTMLDAGIVAAAGSDFSPGPFAPLMGIQGMVTRKGWDGKTWGANQRISVAEAIAVSTYNGAWASKEEHIKGSITQGKLADYVMLAEDPHTVDPETIKDIQIVKTVVGGKTSYEA
jgi:predicted amidohydrolase YtcJ